MAECSHADCHSAHWNIAMNLVTPKGSVKLEQWCHDTQLNDIQHNDTNHKGLKCDIQHNNTATMLSVITLSVEFLYYYGECLYAECFLLSIIIH